LGKTGTKGTTQNVQKLQEQCRTQPVFKSCFIAKNVNVFLCAKHVLQVLLILIKQHSNFIEFQHNKKYPRTLLERTALFNISRWQQNRDFIAVFTGSEFLVAIFLQF